jgi:hypothetical protein
MTEITILLIGLEPTHKLILNQPPLPNWATGANTGKEGIEPSNICFKGRSLCLFAYFPLTAEVGVEPTISCFRDRRLYLFVYSAKI